jgi:WD40 repeat protein
MGVVNRMCMASADHAALATGDVHGFIAVWDLATASQACEARLHESSVTGLSYEPGKHHIISTSIDTYIMAFDLELQQVVDRAVPKSFEDGCGVRNAALGSSSARRGLLLVGGADGVVRLWSKDDGGIRRQGGVPCSGVQPTKCMIADDGNYAVVSGVRGDQVICSGETRPGGVFFF